MQNFFNPSFFVQPVEKSSFDQNGEVCNGISKAILTSQGDQKESDLIEGVNLGISISIIILEGRFFQFPDLPERNGFNHVRLFVQISPVDGNGRFNRDNLSFDFPEGRIPYLRSHCGSGSFWVQWIGREKP